MKLHELKIKHKYFVDVVEGKKTFELRKNDRDYQVDDLIHFTRDLSEGNVFDLEDRLDDNYYIGNVYLITYILKDVQEYGLDKDYCILGIKKLEIK